MVFLTDEITEEEQDENYATAADDYSKFAELLEWISGEGGEFVYVETFSNIKEVLMLVDVIGRWKKPIVTTILVRDNAHCNCVTVSLSSAQVDVQCLLFCMFQA